MMRNDNILWKAFWLIAAGAPVFGGLTAPRSFLDLQQTSDVIVVGSVPAPFPANPVANFSIRVERVVKGNTALTGTAIPVSWSGGAESAIAPGTVINMSGSGLWFLQQSPNGWAVQPVFQGSVPFEWTFLPVPAGSILAAYAYAPGAPLSDRLASEIGSAIEAAGGAFGSQWDSIHQGLLDQLQSPVITLLYQRLSKSDSARQRILGLGGLVRSGDREALATAVQMVSILDSFPAEGGILLSSIRDHFRTADGASITTLGQAATDSNDPNLGFRDASAFALAAIHNLAAVPYLAALLNDPNPQLEIEGIRGIGSFANGLPTQTAAGVASLAHLQISTAGPYRSNETIEHFALGSDVVAANLAPYLQFWKQWWSSNRAALGY